MPDYSLSKIYKLVSNKTTDIYIGSCLMRLSTRLSNHKSKSNTTVSKKLFTEDAIITIVLIESYPCNTKNELKARELHHIITYNCINANKPFVCDILISDRKEYDKIYNKEYYTNHKEEAKEHNKAYYTNHKQEIKIYYASQRDRTNALQRTRYAEKKLTKNLENTLNNNNVL